MEKDKKLYEFNSLEFLNAGVDEIYYRKKHYISGKDTMFLKSMMAGKILQFERMCRYVYYSDIRIPESCYDRVFKEQFPFLYERFHGKEYCLIWKGEKTSINGIAYFTRLLEHIRNINLHAVISSPLTVEMRIDPAFIDEFPKVSENVIYHKNGILTIAGMLIMVFSVMRSNPHGSKEKADIDNELKKSVNYFSNIWGNAIWGIERKNQNTRKLYEYLQGIFRTNYEVEIREPAVTDDVLEMVFGSLYSDVVTVGDNDKLYFSLDLSAREHAPYFGVTGNIREEDGRCFLTIDKGSNIGKCFSDNYELLIEDKTAFMKLCNCVPPFLAVAYLYHNGIDRLSELNIGDIEKVKKLNRPKFYCNKDITILCYGTRYADMREINKSLTEGMLRFLLRFENDLIFWLDIPVYSGYSKLAEVLGKLRLSDEVKSKVVAIRNFCAHYGMLNNFHNTDKKNGYYIDISFIIKTIYGLIDELDEYGYPEIARSVRIGFHDKVINHLIGVKYKRLFEKSLSMFSSPQSQIIRLINDFNRSWGSVENSVIDAGAENILMQAKLLFSFSNKQPIYPNHANKFLFHDLTLICVECEGIQFRGVEVPQSKFMFFRIGSKYPDVFSIGNKKVSLELVSEQKEGLVKKLFYKAVQNEA